MILIDAHQDLAYNILTFGRDYSRSVRETRQLEAGTPVAERTDDSLLGWSEYQQGQVALVFGTLFAAPGAPKHEWDRLVYQDYAQAHELYRSQVDVYYRLVDDHPDKFKLVLENSDLDEVLDAWKQPVIEQVVEDHVPPQERPDPPGRPVGIVMLMEGAEGVTHPGELEEWHQLGVRIIGPAWAGTRFCGGTRQPGPLTRDGYALLEAMGSLDFCLDISHMDEKAVMQALDFYPGAIIASHSNAQSLLRMDSNRHLSDQGIRTLIARDGVIGVVCANHFLKAGWRKGDRRQEVTLQHVVSQVDYICQMAGDALHVGLGSDFDGGFGLQSVPAEIDSIADLQKLVLLLSEKGYADADIAAIFHANWLGILARVLP
jgi:membrane dipeptidase